MNLIIIFALNKAQKRARLIIEKLQLISQCTLEGQCEQMKKSMKFCCSRQQQRKERTDNFKILCLVVATMKCSEMCLDKNANDGTVNTTT